MTAAPIALLTDFASAGAIATLAAARGIRNPLFCVPDRPALDRLFEPFDRERPWPGRLVAMFSEVVVPRRYLEAMPLEAVNIHPGPPEYPGKRAFDFAVHDRAERYGVTAHIMAPQVDSGPILIAHRFEITPATTLDALRFSTWRAGFALVLHLLPELAAEDVLAPNPVEHWSRRNCSEAAWQALTQEETDKCSSTGTNCQAPPECAPGPSARRSPPNGSPPCG